MKTGGGAGAKLNANVDLSRIFKFNFGDKLDKHEKYLIRTVFLLFAIVLVYAVFSTVIMGQIQSRKTGVQEYIAKTNSEIAQIQGNISAIQNRTQEYEDVIERINQRNDRTNRNMARRNAIPNLLTEIMASIPEQVQVLSISNPSGNRITIEARAPSYRHLGLFIAALRNDGILSSVKSEAGQRHGYFIYVTITGTLHFAD